MMSIIKSILDNDLYKFTQGQAVLKLAPNATVVYEFTNRDPVRKFSKKLERGLTEQLADLASLRLSNEEYFWLKENCPYLDDWYLTWLKDFRFEADMVDFRVSNGRLKLTVSGPWCKAIYWEVPLLALISELALWGQAPEVPKDAHKKAVAKGQRLDEAGCGFAEFGTRRRFSFENQRIVTSGLAEGGKTSFVGTSNIYLAKILRLGLVGTMAHELIMAISALRGLRYANKYAMEAWNEVYGGRLGIALTDTYGVEAFFRDFDPGLSRLFDGIRHDSGDPLGFATRAVRHYNSVGVDPATKTIVFSDGLTVSRALRIKLHCVDLGIGCSFGIGTHFSNDIPKVQPLNIVIKLRQINGINVVKLSEDPGKAMGDKKAIEVARWTFGY